MQDSYWLVQVEKNGEGKVCLKFCGHFYISAKHMAYVIAFFGFVMSYLFHYFQ